VYHSHMPLILSGMVHLGLKNKGFGLIVSTEITHLYLNTFTHPL